MKNIKAIIWDLDGVKYHADSKFNQKFKDQSVKLALKYLPNLTSEDEAHVVMQASYDKYGTRYERLFMEDGYDRALITEEFHSGIDFCDLAPSSQDYHDGMMASGVDHIILTHANRSWTRRMLDQLGIAHYFAEGRILTIDDTYPHTKKGGTEAFLRAVVLTGCDPTESLMVEDSEYNLKNAKAIGMTTVLVRPRPGHQKAAYTDYVFDTTEEFLKHFVLARTQNGSL